MPIHAQRSDALYGRLLRQVQTMAAGARLPSVRQMMADHGVSQATIDRALGRLKDEGFVSAERGRGCFASGKRQLGTIALLLPESPSAFELQVLEATRRGLDAAGYALRVETWRPRDGLGARLDEAAADALLVLPSSRPEALAQLQAYRGARPVVQLDVVPDAPAIDAVGSDNHRGGELAAEHLLALGHRRLALVRCEPAVASTDARAAGFRAAADAGGASVELIDCLALQRDAGDHAPGTYAVAHRAIGRLLRERGGDLGVDAAFVDSDLGAIGLIKAAHEAGLHLPDALPVVGFDDLPHAPYIHPALTSLRQDLDGWIRAAVDAIEARLDGGNHPPSAIRLPPQLIVRESCGAAAPTESP